MSSPKWANDGLRNDDDDDDGLCNDDDDYDGLCNDDDDYVMMMMIVWFII